MHCVISHHATGRIVSLLESLHNLAPFKSLHLTVFFHQENRISHACQVDSLVVSELSIETIILKKAEKGRFLHHHQENNTWFDFRGFFVARASEQIRKPLYCYLLHSYPFFLPLRHFDILLVAWSFPLCLAQPRRGTEQQFA